MNKFFYMKLARTNIKKNRKTILPYLFTCIMTTTMFYILCSLSQNEGLMNMPGGMELQLVLSLGKYVIGIFAVIFLFYTNSFLMKQRKKEFGVFNIHNYYKSVIILFSVLFSFGSRNIHDY